MRMTRMLGLASAADARLVAATMPTHSTIETRTNVNMMVSAPMSPGRPAGDRTTELVVLEVAGDMRYAGPVMPRTTAAVATPHPAAAEAARSILSRGGNAVDAAVGAMLASCVVVPGSVGLGGYGGSLIAYVTGQKKVVAIDFDSRAPLAFRPEPFEGERVAYELGYRSISVPGVVAGLAMALDHFGTLPWAIVSEPAIALAEGGVEVSEELHTQLRDWAKKTDPLSLRALFSDGKVPAAGA